VRRITIGIDPGVSCQGVVVLDNKTRKLLAWATFDSSSAYSHFPHGERVLDLTQQVQDWLWDAEEIIYGHPWAGHTTLAIETPVLNTNRGNPPNPSTFGLQWRNIQTLISSVEWDICVEVHNTAVKQALTGKGNATKDDIIAASPFHDVVMPVADREALADAYSVAIAALDGAGTNIIYFADKEMLACREGPRVSWYK
jgi:Holliday junction resolvasome RuvABC endonuclease subunit